MSVTLIGWAENHATADIDGVRVRVRRRPNGIRWQCWQHGTDDHPHCEHLRVLAATAPDPNLYRQSHQETR